MSDSDWIYEKRITIEVSTKDGECKLRVNDGKTVTTNTVYDANEAGRMVEREINETPDEPN